MEISRGDVVLLVFPGDFGKPSLGVVVQSDAYSPMHPSISVCPITSEPEHTGLFGIEVAPTPSNGLHTPGQIIIERISTLPRRKISRVIGRLDHRDMRRVDTTLLRWLGLDEP